MNKHLLIPDQIQSEGNFTLFPGGTIRERVVFPVFYLAPVEYFVLLLRAGKPVFEIHEHFTKQTYRNRCCIAGANGKLNLIIPIRHKGERIPVKETEIANDGRWQKIHWRSIETAYRTSPYFEFYEHIFAPYYEKDFRFLMDFNLALQEEIGKLLEINSLDNRAERMKLTDSFQKDLPRELDFRNRFSSKEDNAFRIPAYQQVFSNKSGFVNNLSIADLIFNLGPETKNYLLQPVMQENEK